MWINVQKCSQSSILTALMDTVQFFHHGQRKQLVASLCSQSQWPALTHIAYMQYSVSGQLVYIKKKKSSLSLCLNSILCCKVSLILLPPNIAGKITVYPSPSQRAPLGGETCTWNFLNAPKKSVCHERKLNQKYGHLVKPAKLDLHLLWMNKSNELKVYIDFVVARETFKGLFLLEPFQGKILPLLTTIWWISLLDYMMIFMWPNVHNENSSCLSLPWPHPVHNSCNVNKKELKAECKRN